MTSVFIRLNQMVESLLGGQVGRIMVSGLSTQVRTEFCSLCLPFLSISEDQGSKAAIARIRFSDKCLHASPAWTEVREEICISSRLPVSVAVMQLISVSRLIYKVLLCRAGAVNVHAAALSFDGDTGLLLSGASGVGKTTLLLSLLKLRGVTVIANDQVLLISRDSVFYAIGMPSLLGVSPDELIDNPSLSRFAYCQADMNKTLLDLQEVCHEYDGYLSAIMQVSAVVSLARSKDDQSCSFSDQALSHVGDIPGLLYPISKAYPSLGFLADGLAATEASGIHLHPPRTIKSSTLSIGLSCLKNPPEMLIYEFQKLSTF